MAHTKAAKKRIKTIAKRTARNKAVKSKVKTSLKRFHAVLAIGDQEKIQKELAQVVKTIDQAASKGVIHKNNAARRKAQLYRALNKASNA